MKHCMVLDHLEVQKTKIFRGSAPGALQCPRPPAVLAKAWHAIPWHTLGYGQISCGCRPITVGHFFTVFISMFLVRTVNILCVIDISSRVGEAYEKQLLFWDFLDEPLAIIKSCRADCKGDHRDGPDSWIWHTPFRVLLDVRLGEEIKQFVWSSMKIIEKKQVLRLIHPPLELTPFKLSSEQRS